MLVHKYTWLHYTLHHMLNPLHNIHVVIKIGWVNSSPSGVIDFACSLASLLGLGLGYQDPFVAP